MFARAAKIKNEAIYTSQESKNMGIEQKGNIDLTHNKNFWLMFKSVTHG